MITNETEDVEFEIKMAEAIARITLSQPQDNFAQCEADYLGRLSE